MLGLRRSIDMKIGFIGLGNMAKAMIGGMLERGIASKEEIIGADIARCSVSAIA